MIYIGKASTLSGASIKAIRHYDELGLLPNLGRSGSYRVFSQSDINTIKLIKQAQQIGFKLAELKSVLLSNVGATAWSEIENILRIKEAQISKEIQILKVKQARLEQYANTIEECLKDDPNCPPLNI